MTPTTINSTHIDIQTRMKTDSTSRAYVPALLKGKHKLTEELGLLDTCSDINAVSPAFAASLELRVKPVKQSQLIEAIDGHVIPSLGTIHTTIYVGTHVREATFHVLECEEPLLIGLQLANQLGIYLANIPTDFPSSTQDEKEQQEYQDMEEELKDRPKPWKLPQATNADDQAFMKARLGPSLNTNTSLPKSAACTNLKDLRFLKLPIRKLDPEEKAPPRFVKQYPLPRYLDNVREQVDGWERDGLISECKVGLYNSPLIAVVTKDNNNVIKKVRVCMDFRHINAILDKNEDMQRVIPKISDIMKRIENMRYASAIDLKAAYHQLPIREKDKHLTQFQMNNRTYHWNRWPFGLHPATGQFQMIMEHVMHGLDYVAIYIDDVLIHSDGSLEDHAAKCQEVIKRLNDAGLKLNPDKCHWGVQSVILLGHLVGTHGKCIDPSKVEKALNYPAPTSGKAMQAFLSFTNFVRDYIPNYAVITAKLQKLRQVKSFVMNEEEMAEYETLRAAIQDCPTLSNPDPELPFHVATDASQYGLGATLYQVDKDGLRKYISFASTSLKGAQINYPATKRELLGIVFALREFHAYIYARDFQLFTDHKALLTVKHTTKPSFTVLNWLSVLNEYSFDIHHRPGVELILPDALSRLHFKLKDDRHQRSLQELQNAGDAMAKDRSMFGAIAFEDREALRLYSTQITSTTARKKRAVPGALVQEQQEFRLDMQKDYTQDNLQSRHIASKAEQQKLLRQYHAKAHMGFNKLMKALWRDNIYWPSMRIDCALAVAGCRSCLSYNISKAGYYPIRSVKANRPNDHWAIDLAISVPTSDGGHINILVVRDVASRYIWAIPITDKEPRTIAQALLTIIMSGVGPPKIIQSDNGGEFVNKIVKELLAQFHIDYRQVCPWNPRANGLAEASVKFVKQCLKKRLAGTFSNWNTILKAIALEINTTMSRYYNATPYSLFYGRPCNTFDDYSKTLFEEEPDDSENARTIKLRNKEFREAIMPMIQKIAYQKQDKTNAKIDKARKTQKPLKLGDLVMVLDVQKQSKWEPKFKGPFTIAAITQNKAYRVKDAAGRMLKTKYPIAHIKPITATLPFTDNNGNPIGNTDTLERYVVQDILDSRVLSDGTEEFLVQWRNYDIMESTWEPRSNFDDINTIINFFRTRATRIRSTEEQQAIERLGQDTAYRHCTLKIAPGEIVVVRNAATDRTIWLAQVLEVNTNEVQIHYLLPSQATSLKRTAFRHAFTTPDNRVTHRHNGNTKPWTAHIGMNNIILNNIQLCRHKLSASSITRINDIHLPLGTP